MSRGNARMHPGSLRPRADRTKKLKFGVYLASSDSGRRPWSLLGDHMLRVATRTACETRLGTLSVDRPRPCPGRAAAAWSPRGDQGRRPLSELAKYTLKLRFLARSTLGLSDPGCIREVPRDTGGAGRSLPPPQASDRNVPRLT